MPDKLTTYVQLAEDTTRAIMHSHETWTAFLSTAARMYKYAYNDQLMIHAQRPAATACAPYEVWNQKMSRYVRRGSKGIALLDSSGDTVALHYVFDVADTGTTRRSPPMNLWQMERHHTLPIMDALQSTYDTAPAGGLERQVEQIALRLSDLYWQEHRVDILGIVDGSFMEGYDELAVGSCFRQAAGISITYTLLERCGLEPQKRFTQEDFIPVFEWNTREATTVLGTAVSEISGQMLRQIERTVKDFDRAHSAERMDGYERTDLQTQRGLSDSESEPKFAGASASGDGRMRKTYLKEHRPILWNNLLLTGKLDSHLREIDRTANSRLEQMMTELAMLTGVTESLKEKSPMAWTQQMNALKAQAEEVLLTELVYS